LDARSRSGSGSGASFMGRIERNMNTRVKGFYWLAEVPLRPLYRGACLGRSQLSESVLQMTVCDVCWQGCSTL
jgi:hypothetical protein